MSDDLDRLVRETSEHRTPEGPPSPRVSARAWALYLITSVGVFIGGAVLLGEPALTGASRGVIFWALLLGADVYRHRR